MIYGVEVPPRPDDDPAWWADYWYQQARAERDRRKQGRIRWFALGSLFGVALYVALRFANALGWI